MALFDAQERSDTAEQKPWSWRRDVFNGYAHTTSRANQYLATDWGSLTTIDLQTIKDSVAQRLAGDLNLADAEAALLILGILTTGRSAADWLASHVVAELSGEEQEVVLQTHGSDWRWQLPLWHVRDKQPSSEFLIQPQSDVDLACVPLMKTALQSCFRARFNTITPPPTPFPLFSTWSFIESEREGDEQVVRGRAARIIRERPGARSSTLTIQSLERWFWAAAAQTEAGDPTSACRMSDREENPFRAQLHYGVMSRAAASKLQRRTLARAGLDGGEAEPPAPDGHIGSCRTPAPELISQFAAHSSQLVSSARRGRDRRGLHNALTFHTAAIIMLSTGLRPARSAHLQFRSDSSLALVCDKVVGDERVRPIPVGQLCREQVAHYLAHLSAMDNLQTTASLQRGVPAELPFTIIDRRGMRRHTTLAACWRLAIRSFSTCLPFNLQRHFLRTALVGSASAESIDAFLGHWVVGTEPWGRFSGLDPLVYAQDIGSLVDHALAKAGWRAEHGLSPKIPSHQHALWLGLPPKADDDRRTRGLLAQLSPFNTALKQPRQRELIPCLPDWFEAPPTGAHAALGQILASAIVNGALLDPTWFDPFLRAIKSMPLRRSRLFVEMEPADPEDTRHVYAYPRRWFCDPVTDLLIRRWRGLQVSSPDERAPSAEACFLAFLTNRGQKAEVGTFARIVQEATLRWRLAMPGLLVSYAAGEGPSLSLPSTAWDRVESARRIAAEKPTTQTGSRARVYRVHYPGLYQSLIVALKSSNPAGEVAKLTCRLPSGDDRLISHLLRWAALAIGPRGRSSEGRREWGQKRPYSPANTIVGYAGRIADLLSDKLDAKLGDMDAAQLDELYRTGFEEIEKPSDRNKALNAVLLFQGYLGSLSPELDVGDSYDEYREEGRVSVNVISSEDYQRALEQLPGEGRDARLRRLVLMLAFRTGLRLNEVLGLRHEDLASGADPLAGGQLLELYVRPYSSHFLKTQQSRRMIPLDVLLTPDELQDLVTWRNEHATEARVRPSGLLFTHAGGGSGRPVAGALKKQLVDALVRATGDEGIRFEHLRHSFATHLLACLLLPREGSYLLPPKGFDPNSVSNDRRDRVIARVSGSERPGRSALHIVSQLCGHGPVTTTLRWYAHMLDWSVGAFVNRRALQPRISRRAALRIRMQTKKDYSGESLSRADHRHRTKLSPTPESRGVWERYRTPEPAPDLRWADENVPLMAVHRSIQRRFDHLAGNSFSKGARPLRRLRAPAPQAPVDDLPGWRDIRDAVISARNGERSTVTASRLGVTPETIVRYRRIADLIAGPRRRGEARMRFEPKMSAARKAAFNVDEWRRSFPQEPLGRDALDIVDHVWRTAGEVHTDKHVIWALQEFCRYYSVDTSFTSFLKRKDAARFYRGLVMLGFGECLSVVHLDKRKRRPDCRAVKQNGNCDCGCDQLRRMLAAALPKTLRPEPKKVTAEPQGPFPRAVAIHVGLPRVPGRRLNDLIRPNNHTRAAVRFALTMLAIATLDNIKEPSRRRGWRPGYGGYF